MRLHVLTRDGVPGEAVDVERDEESVEEVVCQHPVEALDVEGQDVVDVVEVVQVLRHHVLQLVDALVVRVVPNTVVNLQDVVPDEPDQVGEVRSRRLICHKLKHPETTKGVRSKLTNQNLSFSPLILHLVHVEAERPDRDPHHALAVVEELDGLGVEREVIIVLVIEEVDGVLVEAEAQGLEEGDVVGHHLLVTEVELVHDDVIDVIVGEQVVDAGVVPDVLEEDVQGLEELDADVVVASLLVHELEEEAEHVPLEEEIKH